MKKIEKLRLELDEINHKYADDEEAIHCEMDDALLEYIGDDEVKRLFNLWAKWCA